MAERKEARLALDCPSLDFRARSAKCGIATAASMPMTATTIISSIKVNPNAKAGWKSKGGFPFGKPPVWLADASFEGVSTGRLVARPDAALRVGVSAVHHHRAEVRVGVDVVVAPTRAGVGHRLRHVGGVVGMVAGRLRDGHRGEVLAVDGQVRQVHGILALDVAVV